MKKEKEGEQVKMKWKYWDKQENKTKMYKCLFMQDRNVSGNICSGLLD